MKYLSEKLNFSDKKENNSAIKIKKWGATNYYETLNLYMNENNISFKGVTPNELDGCSITMEQYGQDDKSIDHYYFWIDKAENIKPIKQNGASADLKIVCDCGKVITVLHIGPKGEVYGGSNSETDQKKREIITKSHRCPMHT